MSSFSRETLETVASWSEVLAAVFGILAATAAVVYLLANKPLRKIEALESQQEKQKTALAQKEAAEAQLALRKELLRQGARGNLLVGSARDKLIASLKPFAGQTVEVRYGLSTMGTAQSVPEPAGSDVMGLADSLIKVLQEARWELPAAPLISSLQWPPGMTVQISPKASPSTVSAADTLVKSLREVPLEVQGPSSTELSGNPRIGTVRVFTPNAKRGPATEKPLPPQTNETIVLVVLAHPQ